MHLFRDLTKQIKMLKLAEELHALLSTPGGKAVAKSEGTATENPPLEERTKCLLCGLASPALLYGHWMCDHCKNVIQAEAMAKRRQIVKEGGFYRPKSLSPKSVHQLFIRRPELVGLGGKRSEVSKRGTALGAAILLKNVEVCG